MARFVWWLTVMENKITYAIGMMTGTSLDGCDLAYVAIWEDDQQIKHRLLHYKSYELPDSLKQEILRQSRPETSSVDAICQLNFDIGKRYSNYVKQFKKEFAIETLDFIATHGQTIYHHPTETVSTLQIGDPSYLAVDHQTIVISDFRAMDIAAGGTGAPLVPYTDYLLFAENDRTVCCLNIGGIANVTILPKKDSKLDIVAFDTGPGNMMINAAMQTLYQKAYDHGGEVALSGVVDETLLIQLCDNPYLKVKPPKSTGRELFGENFVNSLIENHDSIENSNFIRTLSAFTSKTIADSLNMYYDDKVDVIIVSGGGAYNEAILLELRNRTSALVITQESLGNSSDAKEAIAFALLGYQSLQGRPNNVPSATGANRTVILGKITNGTRRKL